MKFRITNSQCCYDITASSVEAAMKKAEGQHLHAIKQGWTYRWMKNANLSDGGRRLVIFNSKGHPMKNYGCALRQV